MEGIDVGKRGEQFASLCSGFGLIITNDDDHHDPLVGTWTFGSSMGIKQHIDFIASSRSLCLLGSSATDLLNLGSDHRAVRATYLIGSKPKKVPHGEHRVERGWRPTLDSCGCPLSYHEMLHAELGHEPQSLIELESFCCRASAQENTLYWLSGGERDQSHRGQNFPNLFGNIFGGHFVSREMVGLNMFWSGAWNVDVWRQ